MPHLAPALRRRLAVAAAATLVIGVSPFLTPAAAHAATFTPKLDCPPEQYPPKGSPRSAASQPYQVPFNAQLGVPISGNGDGGDGGYIVVDAPSSMLQLTLGPPDAASTTGTLFGDACGTFSIPSLVGNIPGLPALGQAGGVAAPENPNYNNNFILHGAPFGTAGIGNPITVGIGVAGVGASLATLSGVGSADGAIANHLGLTPAANGGLTVSFGATAKATAVLNPTALASLIPLLPASVLGSLAAIPGFLTNGTGGTCTLSLGDQRLTGYTESTAGFTTPADLSTTDTADGGKALTGPIDNAQGVAAGSGIIQPPIDPNEPPDPYIDSIDPAGTTTAPSSLCSPALATILNGLLGLTSTPVAADKFVAPLTVQAYATQ